MRKNVMVADGSDAGLQAGPFGDTFASVNALLPTLSFTFDERRTVQACAVLILAGATGRREN